mmetsp:Transcript_90797/g.293125  ORF Transcript_90797/g.293125 Transcript_90797/m.293125 type:complete len:293 (+) Transcript_90797:103-981(+)
MKPADMAAFAASDKPPPPLPLPPGLTVSDLPAMLRPTLMRRRSQGGSVRPGPRAGSCEDEGKERASSAPVKLSAEKLAMWETGRKVQTAEDKPPARTASAPPVAAQEAVLPPDAAQKANEDSSVVQPQLALARGFARRSTAGKDTGESGSVPEIATDIKDAYLWTNRSDGDLVRDIEHTLTDFDTLQRECEDLFHACCTPSSPASSGQEASTCGEPRLPSEQLQKVTQSLIDKLGCRSPPVLERIGLIYSTVLAGKAGGGGLSYVEFRGFVASVLTQIQRELEDRGELKYAR